VTDWWVASKGTAGDPVEAESGTGKVVKKVSERISLTSSRARVADARIDSPVDLRECSCQQFSRLEPVQQK